MASPCFRAVAPQFCWKHPKPGEPAERHIRRVCSRHGRAWRSGNMGLAPSKPERRKAQLGMTTGTSNREQWNPLKVGKAFALQGARNLGIYSVMKRSEWRRRQLLILAYHGISQLDEHKWRPSLYMSPDLFASRLTTLSQSGCNVLSLGEALLRLKQGTLPPQSVVLTFDDGYFNFYQYAYPILRRFNYPATVYQTTYYVNVRQPIFHLVTSYLLWKSPRKTLDAKPLIGTTRHWDLSTQENIASANFEIWKFAKSAGMCIGERQQLVERLADFLGVDYAEISNRRMFELMT